MKIHIFDYLHSYIDYIESIVQARNFLTNYVNDLNERLNEYESNLKSTQGAIHE